MTAAKQITRKVNLFYFLRGFLFHHPVAAAYYATKGVDFGVFLATQALYRYLLAFLEIPTGYLSDMWNRKNVIIFGGAFWVLGQVLLFLADSVAGVLWSEVLMALGASFLSGTMSAYLYEALEAEGAVELATERDGSMRGWNQYGTAFALLVGASAYSVWIHLPILMSIAAQTAALWVSFTFANVPRTMRRSSGKSHFQDALQIVGYVLRGHEVLKWVILYAAALFSGSVLLFWSFQKMRERLDIAPSVFGVMLCCYFMAQGICNAKASWVVEKLGAVRVSLLLMGLAGAAWALFTAVFHPIALLVAMMCGALVLGVGRPFFVNLVNRYTSSDMRATALSATSFVESMLAATLMAASMPLMHSFGIWPVLQGMAVCLVVAGVWSVWGLVGVLGKRSAVD